MQVQSQHDMYARLLELMRVNSCRPSRLREREIERLFDYLQVHNPDMYDKVLHDFNVADILTEDILYQIHRIDFMSKQEIHNIIHKLNPAKKANINTAIGVTDSDEFEFFKVTGRSMVEADILPGDQVVIQKTARPKNGDTVVANINGKILLKQYYAQDDGVLLKSAAKDIPPMFLEYGEPDIRGVVIGIVRGK
ncbi:MAG TPA: S24 family peptidase [Candidatus Kapabacteria bacterium]|nr:S24 family peptidase [Candidatus Kapabacteria bacterium]